VRASILKIFPSRTHKTLGLTSPLLKARLYRGYLFTP
jgi:hypothetical protein